MELFSEIYSCYYQVLRHLLCSQDALSIQDIRSCICGEGFEESLLSIIPKLENGTWNLFEKDGKLYHSRLSSSFITPVSDLEKSYLRALLSDPRIGLFLNREQLEALDKMLASVAPLWDPEQFCYFDRFSDGAPYEDENYRSCFRTLLQAQKENRYAILITPRPAGTAYIIVTSLPAWNTRSRMTNSAYWIDARFDSLLREQCLLAGVKPRRNGGKYGSLYIYRHAEYTERAAGKIQG